MKDKTRKAIINTMAYDRYFPLEEVEPLDPLELKPSRIRSVDRDTDRKKRERKDSRWDNDD